MDEATKLLIKKHAYLNMIGKTSGWVDNARNVVILRGARATSEDEYLMVLRMILDGRAEHRRWLTLVQRDWQTKVSRRPQRGNHHDSWSIREKYVRCAA